MEIWNYFMEGHLKDMANKARETEQLHLNDLQMFEEWQRFYTDGLSLYIALGNRRHFKRHAFNKKLTTQTGFI